MSKPSGESKWLIPVCFAARGVHFKGQLSRGQRHVVQKRESSAAHGWWYVLGMANVPGSTQGCMHEVFLRVALPYSNVFFL